MATFIVTVPDTEADRFSRWVALTEDAAQPRIIKVERLSPAIEASNAQRDKFMAITEYVTTERH